jgi:hypothetical protein
MGYSLFHNKFTGLYKIIFAVLFLIIALVPIEAAGKKAKLTGRVLAVSFWPITKDLMHGNVLVQEFIFGMETKDRRGNVTVVPVFVVNRAYPWAEEFLLPEDFFDYF